MIFIAITLKTLLHYRVKHKSLKCCNCSTNSDTAVPNFYDDFVNC